MAEKWIVGLPGGPAGPFYSVVSQQGRVIAMQIIDEGMAYTIAQLPQLIELRYEWAVIINRLANIALDGANSNDRDFAQDMIEMVAPYLDGATIVE
jgi:hypothetical protein